MAVSFTLRRWHVYEWSIYIFVAGPIAWFGLLKSGAHPALAFVFVVPFMPHTKPTAQVDDRSATDVLGNDEGAVVLLDKNGAVEKIPLFEFGHNTQAFVDVFVMFLFGLVNAGIELDHFGPYSVVIVLSLFFGKTLGIGGFAQVLVLCGYPLPGNLTMKSAWLVAMIHSVGLTVALVIADRIFEEHPVLQNEAKLGALLSLAGSLFTLMLSRVVDVSTAPSLSPETDELLLADEVEVTRRSFFRSIVRSFVRSFFRSFALFCMILLGSATPCKAVCVRACVRACVRVCVIYIYCLPPVCLIGCLH